MTLLKIQNKSLMNLMIHLKIQINNAKINLINKHTMLQMIQKN